MRPLFKTTVVIWSEYDAGFASLEDLGRDAMEGESYCSIQRSEHIIDPELDPQWDGTEFFGIPGEYT